MMCKRWNTDWKVISLFACVTWAFGTVTEASNTTNDTTVDIYSRPLSSMETTNSITPAYDFRYYSDPYEEASFLVENDIDTKNFISSFESDFQKLVIKAQLKSCPYVALCNYTLQMRIFTSFYSDMSCCMPCHCDFPKCLARNDCCPDILRQDHLRPRVDTELVQCIGFEFGNFNVRIENGVLGIAYCLDHSDAQLSHNCSRVYEMVNLSSIGDVLPYVDLKTGTRYRNKYCVKCHGQSEEHLEPFKVQVLLSSDVSAKVVSSEEIMLHLAQTTTHVKFNFIDPYPSKGNYCIAAVSSCNITGEWFSNTDNITKTACEMYTSELTLYGVTFNNLFCAQCNGVEYDAFDCYYPRESSKQRFSFSGLLRMTSLTKNDHEPFEDQDSKCSSSQLYNLVTDTCLNLSCSEIHDLHEQECFPMFTELTNIVYNIYIITVPLENITVSKMHEIVTSVLLNINRLFQEIVPNFEMVECGYQTLITTDTSSDLMELPPALEKNATVLDMITRFQFDYSYDFQDPLKLIQAMLEDIHNTELVVDDKERGTFRFKLKVYQEELDSEKHSSYFDRIFAEHIVHLENHLVSSVSKTDCNIQRNVRIEGLFTLQPCPRVTLHLENIQWSMSTHRQLNLNDTLIIDSTDFYMLNKTEVVICVDIYKKYLDIIKSKKVDENNGQLTPKQIISIIFSTFSIVALLLTILVFCFVRKLWHSLPGKNNFTLAAMLLCAQCLYVVASFGGLKPDSNGCKALGLLLHLFWLNAIMWMNVCTCHMFSVLTKTQLASKSAGWKRYILYHIYASAVSVGTLAVNIIWSRVVTDTMGYGNEKCYISFSNMILFTFALPVAVVILSNLVMFGLVIWKIKRAPSVQRIVKQDRNDLIVFAKLSSVTGVMWIIGVINVWIMSSVLDYIFIILNCCQGVYIFLAFIVNKRVWNELQSGSFVSVRSTASSATKSRSSRLHHNVIHQRTFEDTALTSKV